jgi:uncharacterized protein YjbI with pentapeptide repeats
VLLGTEGILFGWVLYVFGVEIEASDELVAANLSGINLSRSILAEMSLDRVNFSDANLRDTNFGQTSLDGANLQRADLSGLILDMKAWMIPI